MEKFNINKYISDTKTDKNISDYNQRYEQIKTNIKSSWFSVKDSGHLVVKFNIPSEKAGSVAYDVIVEFNVGSDATYKEFKTTQLRVFSNCPSFIFMNAYFCKMNDLLIDWAIPLYKDPNAFNSPAKDPKDTNAKPEQTKIKCEKSLYFAFKLLSSLNPIQMYLNASQSTKLPNSKILLHHLQGTEEVNFKRSDSITKEKVKVEKAKNNEIASIERKMKLKSIFNIKHSESVGSVKSNNNKVSSIKKVKHI